MKKLGLILTLFAMVFAFQANAQSESGAVITFKEKSVDFGDITQGDKVSHTFELTNTGTTPLIISNVAATCGCTVPSWPKDPIAPGAKAKIEVSFNSAGKMGKQNSVVRIYSNASEPIEKVSLISNVLPKTK
ncbi:MAG TPA: DUF1573 domain-containing protein [Algoriphagus sp.]|jgi:hypothetical protein|uniref:DUF1573 domain-containing protein n=1 Tax=Algoriphagus ornithinivorans TaxID=226506 RepID=A0A1I5IWB7_9BACT|nr:MULTISPECIES: DUF1573 domain-containing protein [Algoriphagus]MAL12848.1 DUF1573 domain-containing protein [Algoriphagus sp.]QYH39125.1 DUF1573 domain-containing protein [Algoriphagus sp. NBT04N3]SFO64874.1 Protein of unknown function [Algoriphagus ornithinivorans]HAD50630.1 DUF1573 domain-containing protein [Algoriphagus sp.]HAH37279.1 DUF1573 domain-containing protein [Algoriphagus sp.]|tara:strand:+ start:738 stop:1133 length:396 start_codon:yes stop_codon:yes gene_type:complete